MKTETVLNRSYEYYPSQSNYVCTKSPTALGCNSHYQFMSDSGPQRSCPCVKLYLSFGPKSPFVSRANLTVRITVKNGDTPGDGKIWKNRFFTVETETLSKPSPKGTLDKSSCPSFPHNKPEIAGFEPMIPQ